MVHKIKKFSEGAIVELRMPHRITYQLPYGKEKITSPLERGKIIKVNFLVKSNYVPVRFEGEKQYFLIRKKELKVI